jgi:isopentenyl diphosphate isomerase/L-lactate dehydrogenase-like FMN-dependent dehydrogenase
MLKTGIARATIHVRAEAVRTVRIPAAIVARAAAEVRRIQMSDIFLDAFARVPEWDLIAELSSATSEKARPADAKNDARAMGAISWDAVTAERSGSAYQLQAMTKEPKINVFFSPAMLSQTRAIRGLRNHGMVRRLDKYDI